MTTKNHAHEEEKAWQEYIAAVESKTTKKPKKGKGFGYSIKTFLERIGIGKKAKEKKAVQKEIAISAAEAKKGISGKKPTALKPSGKKTFVESIRHLEKGLKKVEKEIPEKKIPEKVSPEKAMTVKAIGIDKYIEKMEKSKRAEAALKAIENVELDKRGKVAVGAIKEVELDKRAKVALETVKKEEEMEKKAETALKAVEKAKKKQEKEDKKKALAEKKKVGKKAKPSKKAGKAKKAAPGKGLKPEEEKIIEKIIKKEPGLVEKSAEEIKQLSPKEIKKELKLEKMIGKARGWYGDALKHKKAALSGWRIRKKVKLHHIRKKEKKGEITTDERKKKKQLMAEDRDLTKKIKNLENQIRTLEFIEREKEAKAKKLEKKVAAIGVKIPKIKDIGGKKGASEFNKKSEIVDLVEAMRTVADEMAATATKQSMANVTWKDSLNIDDQISAQQNLIKNLELAFYKRKVDFEQFREKLFEYQSKLSELRIRKKIAENRKANLSPEVRKAMEEATAMRKQAVGISPKASKALEKMANMPIDVRLGKDAIDAIKKLTAKEVERVSEKAEEKKFAERTAAALQQIAEKLATAPRPVAQAPPAAPVARPAPPMQPAGPVQQKPGFQLWQKPTARSAERTYPEERRPRPYPEEEYRSRRPREREESPLWPEEDRKRPRRKRRIPEERYVEEPVETIVEGTVKTSEKAAPKKGGAPRVIERIRERIIERVPFAKPAEQQPVSKLVDNAIKQKAMGSNVDQEQINRIEGRLGELLKKYHIPDNALAARIQTLDSGRLVQDFQKLIKLIEEKKGGAAVELIRPGAGFDIKTGLISRKREKIVGKEKEIRKAKIETSFDRVLGLVQVKGTINLNDVAKQLGMTSKEVKECAEILERSKLIKLNYPPIGAVKLVYPQYIKWKQQQKRLGKK